MARYYVPLFVACLFFFFLFFCFSRIFTLSILSLQAGKYVWLSYQEVYDLVLKVGTAVRFTGVAKVSYLCEFIFS